MVELDEPFSNTPPLYLPEKPGVTERFGAKHSRLRTIIKIEESSNSTNL